MLTEREAYRRLETDASLFPPLKLSLDEAAQEPWAPAGSTTARTGPDWVLTAEWEGTRFSFAVEFKTSATPKQVELGIEQARRYAANLPATRPMLMAPYLSPKALDRLIEARVSGIDFSGNGAVIVPGRWLLVRTGAPNRYPASQSIKAIYAGTSSLVPRVLLVRPRYATVGEVREEILRRGGEISLATVSKVLKMLEEELIVGRGPDGSVRLLQADRLLDNLLESYRRPRPDARTELRVDDRSALLRAVTAREAATGLRVAVDGEQRWAVMPSSVDRLRAYVTSIDAVLEATPGADTSGRFANLELVETRAPELYFDRRELDGVRWTSPTQTYLDLAAGGKRERDVALQLRGELLREAAA